VPHVARPEHKARHPVHLTLRAVRRLPSLRKQTLFLEVRRALALCSGEGFRVVHFSVQADHVHLLVEAEDKNALSRGARGLAIRLARKVNGILHRRGRVWGDRYHAHPLSTPREVRNAIVYVLMNWKKHVAGARGLDECASVEWFDGWRGTGAPRRWLASSTDPPPVVPTRTWLGSVGWRRCGLVDRRERPAEP
jgi:REP element-mobilizing transposase RayT